MAASVGWIVGPSVGAGLSGLGFGFLFLVAGVIVAGYAVILLVGLRETRPAAALAGAPEGPTSAGPELAGEPPHPGGDSISSSLDIRRALAIFLVLAMAFHGAQFLWVAILPIYAHDLGVSTATWGLLFALNGILILVLQLRISSLSERRSRPRFMAAGALLSGLGYLVVAGIPGAIGLVLPLLGAAIVLVTFGEMAFFPVAPSFVSDLSPAAIRGRYQGYLGAATGLGTAVAPVVAGAVLDAAPGPLAWLGASGALALIACGLWWLGGRDPAAAGTG
jgi:MFS family permease